MKLSASQILALGAVGIAGAVVYFGARKVGEVARAVNPASSDNIVYRGVNALGGAVTGDRNFSFGSWVYDVFHRDDFSATAPIRGPLE
jgi:hypothetical protein